MVNVNAISQIRSCMLSVSVRVQLTRSKSIHPNVSSGIHCHEHITST